MIDAGSDSRSRPSLAILGGPREVPPRLVKPWPQIGDSERRAIGRVLDRGELWGHAAPEISSLEQEFAATVGARYCLATNSGTAALHMAIAGVGVEPGDEVLTTAVSWTSTATSILQHNAVPVFVDVEPDTGNMDAGWLADKISDRTRAILVVHLAGLPADMGAISELATQQGIPVIEDASQAHGATLDGKAVGSLGDAAVFSVHASKHLPSAGEGGLFVTNREDVFRRAARVHQFGEERQPGRARCFEPVTVGWNYRMTEIAAAFVRSQLVKLGDTVARVRANSLLLSERLAGMTGWLTPAELTGRAHTFWRYTIRLDVDAMGIAAPPRTIGQRIRAALWAEGVPVELSDVVLPLTPLFQERGAPSRIPSPPDREGRERSYRPLDFPNAVRFVELGIPIGGRTPPNAEPAVDAFAAAIRKVQGGLADLMDAKPDEIMSRIPSDASITYAAGRDRFRADLGSEDT
jgi:perosamine synthetase